MTSIVVSTADWRKGTVDVGTVYGRNVGSVNLGRTRGDNVEQTESKDIQKENIMNLMDGLGKNGLKITFKF